MPTKTYKYNVVIGVGVGTSNLSKGSKEVEDHLSRWERRAIKAVKSIEKALDELNKVEDKVFSDNSRKNGGSSGKWTQEHQNVLKATQMLNRYDLAIDRLGGKQTEVKKLNQQLADPKVASTINENTKAILRQKAATIDQIRAAKDLEKANQKAFREQRQQTRQRFSNMQTVGGGMQSAGVGMTAAVTVPVIAGFSKTIEIGVKYEESMNIFGAVTQATADEMKKADALAIKLGNDLTLPGVSAVDAAKAMTELGKAGMTASESMAAAQGTLRLATAANIDAGQAASITANALNMFGLEASEAGRIADLLAGAANASSAEITDVAASLQQAGAVFASAKVPIEDVVTLIGEMANNGIKGSDAGTSLKTMMQRLQSPTDNAAQAMKALNVQVYDQQGRMKPMRDIIGQFEKSLKGLTQQQKDQALNTIFGSDAVRAATIIFEQGTAGFDKMAEGVKRLNAAQELAAARSKGLGGAWNALKSQAETVGLIIYNRIKEPLTEILIFISTFVQKVTDAFVALPEGVQQGILAFAALLAAIGPVLAIVGTLIVALGSVGTALMTLTGAATVGAALSALGPVIAGIVGVIAALTVGIGAAIGVVYGLVEAWENGFGPVASIVAIAIGGIITAFNPIIGIPILIAAMFTTLYEIWTTNFAGLRDFAIQIWDAIVSYVQFTLGKYLEIINAVGGRIIAWWRQNYPLIQETVVNVQIAIQSRIQSFLDWISAFWQAHGTKILETVNWIWSNIKAYVMYAVNNILDIITIVLQLINGKWSDAWASILKMTQRVTKFIISAIWGFVKMVGEAIVKLNKWIYNNIGAIISKVASMVANGLKYLVMIIAFLPLILIKLVPKFISAGMQIGQAIWQGIKDGLTGSGNAPAIESFDASTVFADFPGFNPDAMTDNQPNFIDKLTNSMNELGESTKNTNSQLGNFNDNLGTGNKRSRETKQNNGEMSSRAKALVDAANELGIDPLDLATIISYETAGTFNPNIVGGKNNGYQGLIQFGKEERQKYNVYKGQSFENQVTTSVVRYFQDRFASVGRSTRGATLLDLYKTVNGGNPNVSSNASDGYTIVNGKRVRNTIAGHVEKMQGRHQQNALNKIFDGKRPTGTTEKSMEVVAAENRYNEAKQRVQELISLSQELNVALEVSTEVTTTNDALIQQQKMELKNLQDLKKKREDILEIVGRLGLKEEEFARANLTEADFSLARLNAIEDSQKFITSAYDASIKKLQDLQAMAANNGEVLTPLQEFNAEVERMAAKTGLSTEEFERLNPQLIETRENLEKIAEIELANKIRENFKKFHQEITKEIDEINREIELLGITDPAERKKRERAYQIADYIEQNFADADILTKIRVAAEMMRKFAAQDKLDGIHKAAENTKFFEEKVEELNEALRGNIALTERQKLEIDLTTGKLKDLTDEQKNRLRVLQDQLDVQREIDRYNDKIRQIGDAFGQVFADSFTALFTKGFNSALETLQKGLKDFFKQIWLNIVNQFAQRISKSISDKIMDIFGMPGGSTEGGAGLFGGWFNRGTNQAQTGNLVQTVQNVPQIINTQGGTTPVISSQQVNAVTQSGQMQVGGGSGVNTAIGANVPTLTTNTTPQSLGGAMQQINSGLPTVLAGRNRSVRNMPTGSIVDGAMVVNGRSRFSQMFGKGGIFGEQGFGFNSGTIGTLGALGGMAGSIIGGPVGSIMMGAASGIGMMSSLSSMLGISSLGGPVGLAVGAAIGGLMALGSILFGRNKQRKADEKTRNTAMGDAFKAIDKLISDVNSDKIDGEQALSQAEEIRKNYLDQMGQLKDKKTRRIALADVSRIDAKISTLKSAVAAQGQRKDKMIMLSPTFADGGGVSDFISSNYRNNPLGYVQGPGSSRSDSISAWFPVAGTFGRISNREYVLDAETTGNVGIWNLDRLRAGKGRNLGEIARMMNRVHEPRIKLADGGAVSSFSSSGTSSGTGAGGTGSTIQMKAETHVAIYQSGDGSIESVSAETYLDTPQGKQKIESIVEGKIYENKSSGKIPTAINRVNKGQS